MSSKTFGWFFQFRGNGYGPYVCREQADNAHKAKCSAEFPYIDNSILGTAHVDENKNLIKFEKFVPEFKQVKGIDVKW